MKPPEPVTPEAQFVAPADYASYLRLDLVLGAQHPLADDEAVRHDEALFIVHHQIAELWLNLLLRELGLARRALASDDAERAVQALARAEKILHQLVGQWPVIDTMTSEMFGRIRPRLGSASGIQSAQFAALDLLVGRRPATSPRLDSSSDPRPSLFDETLRWLHRQGHPVPPAYTERDWSETREASPQLVELLRRIRRQREAFPQERLVLDYLAGFDAYMRLWRLEHVRVTARLIGDLPGTAGTAGVAYLRRAVDRMYFPELFC